jgi:hypothetical protein
VNAGTLATDIGTVQGVAGEILTTIEAVDPAADVPAEAAQAALTLIASLVTAALTAWSNASGTPITIASVTALLPDPTPLPEPPTPVSGS